MALHVPCQSRNPAVRAFSSSDYGNLVQPLHIINIHVPATSTFLRCTTHKIRNGQGPWRGVTERNICKNLLDRGTATARMGANDVTLADCHGNNGSRIFKVDGAALRRPRGFAALSSSVR